jgi:hypothetical protein
MNYSTKEASESQPKTRQKLDRETVNVSPLIAGMFWSLAGVHGFGPDS